jgi:hypothetical protein
VPYLAALRLVGLHQREARRRNVGALRPGAERVADEGAGEVAFSRAKIAGQKKRVAGRRGIGEPPGERVGLLRGADRMTARRDQPGGLSQRVVSGICRGMSSA